MVFKDDEIQEGYSVDDGAVMLSQDILTTSSLPSPTIKVSYVLDGKFVFKVTVETVNLYMQY